MPGGYNYPLSVGQGQVNVAVSTWALGDVNHDGKLDSTDIDAIYQHLGSVATNLHLIQYDVNGDNLVSQADVTWELQNVFHTSYADANLDCKVDFYDFQVLLYHWLATGLGWAGGDFNGDGVVDYGDFQILLDYWNPVGIGLGPAMMQASQASTSVATSTTAAATTTTTSATTTTSTTPSSGATDSSSTTSADVATASPSSATASAATTVSPSLVASATPDPAVALAKSGRFADGKSSRFGYGESGRFAGGNPRGVGRQFCGNRYSHQHRRRYRGQAGNIGIRLAAIVR